MESVFNLKCIQIESTKPSFYACQDRLRRNQSQVIDFFFQCLLTDDRNGNACSIGIGRIIPGASYPEIIPLNIEDFDQTETEAS